MLNNARFKVGATYHNAIVDVQIVFTQINAHQAIMNHVVDDVLVPYFNKHYEIVDGYVSVQVEDIIRMNKKTFTPLDVDIRRQGKPSVVEVIRFVRPMSGTCWNDNLYGVTLIFQLDYDKRLINVQISVCNGDNFSKKDGVEIAREGNHQIMNMNMPDEIYNCNSDGGLVQWFFEDSPGENAQNHECLYQCSYKVMKSAINIYQHSKRFQF